jgi:DNA repair exonuclease SbcCD ATPase subunit
MNEHDIVHNISKLLIDVLTAGRPPEIPERFKSNDSLQTAHSNLMLLREFLHAASNGDLSGEVQLKGFIGGTIKTLQANLKHLAWQAERVASGDFSQRVDFMGEFSKSFNEMVKRLDQTLTELVEKKSRLSAANAELQEALARIKTLTGLLPICSACKKIRNDQGNWEQIEVYIRDRSEADFSHGICPDCLKKLYPEIDEGG